MSPKLRRILVWGGYPLYSLVLFVVCLYFTFPYERIKSLIEDQLSSSGRMTVTIGELGPSPLLGMTASDIKVVLRPKPVRRPGAAGQPGGGGAPTSKPKPMRMLIDEVSIGAGIGALLGGGIDVDFDVDGLGGEIVGSYKAERKKGWTLALRAEEIAAKEIPQLQASGPPVRGTLSAKVDLSVPGNRVTKAKGVIEFTCKSCSVGDNKAKIKIPGNPMMAMGITLPRVRIGRLSGMIKVDDGVATFERLSARSPDIELELEGRLNLRKPMAFSMIQAYLRFKISDAFLAKNSKFAILTTALARGKRPDGFYGMSITGLLRRPRVVPSRRSPVGGGGGSGRPGRPGAARRHFP